MDYRKFAIRVLYASISIAVFAGVMTLFAPGSREVIGRLLGTAITTAIASALLLVAIRALETPTSRHVGTTLGVVVCCVYASIICAIWIDLINQPLFSSLQQKFAMTASLLSFCSIPILIGAACITRPRLKLAGIVLFGIWIVFLTIWLLNIWIPVLNYYNIVQNFTAPLAIFSPICALVLIGRNARSRQIGITIAALGCIALQIAVFIGDPEDSPNHFMAALVFGWAGAQLGLWNLITFRDAKYAVIWLERVAGILCGIALASLCIVIWLDFHDLPLGDLLGRISGSSGILASASVLAIIVTQLLRASVFDFWKVGVRTELPASCPRCMKNLFIPQGKSVCPYCNLQFKVQIESVGCRVCGYDLSGSIESNCCPECGEPIILTGMVE